MSSCLQSPELPPPGQCTALVLAGGAGRRMGGVDKGLLPWRNGTLAGHTAARLTALGLPVWISANRHGEDYRQLGYPVLADVRSDFAGPLAALEAGLQALPTPWLLALPCDSPFFPETLPARLWAALHPDPAAPEHCVADAAFTCCGDAQHPVFCLVARPLGAALTRFLDGGGRRVRDWWQEAGALAVDFGADSEAAFANANTPEELAALRQRDGQPEAGGSTCSS